jgi:hypothetical protein
LRADSAANVRVLIVWEPVLSTDWGDPSPSLTSLITDNRAIQFWDRDRKLSSLLGGPGHLQTLARLEKVGFQMKDVIWDAALLYPAGAVWGSPADLLVAPVVKFSDALGAAFTP